MRRSIIALMTGVFIFGLALGASAATEIKMTGDMRMFGEFVSMKNFTGWDATGAAKENKFGVWQRFRLRTDFIANENLKFRLAVKLDNQPWGGTTGLQFDNPQTNLLVYEAYLYFKWPDSEVEITAGYQPLALPQSSFMGGNVVLNTDSVTALTVTAPLMGETLGVQAGYARMTNLWPRYYSPTSDGSVPWVNTGMRSQAGTFDDFFLAFPVKLEGFTATPWANLAIIGRDAAVGGGTVMNYGFGPGTTINEDLVSVGTVMRPDANRMVVYGPNAMAGWYKKATGFYGWAGLALECEKFDPFKFYADVIWGGGEFGRKVDNRSGWFVDAAVEYTGFSMVTPQFSAWWSSGEDGSFKNGSERMPTLVQSWGPSNSYLFDSMQEFTPYGPMYVNPVGSWGLNPSLNNISFIEKLEHRITFTVANGTNSPSAIRKTTAVYGSGGFFQMGRDLATTEWIYGIAFDHKYMIYDNLALIAELGWAHGNFQKSLWGYNVAAGQSFASRARDGDNFKLTLGFKYKF